MRRLFSILLLFLSLKSVDAQIVDFNHLNFKKADSIALALKGESLTNLPELSYKLTNQLTTEAERFRAIYRWVCDNIANDYTLYLKNDRQRRRFKDDSLKFSAWNTKFRSELFGTLLKKKRTICTGYAYLVKTLSDFADLECEIVQGFGRVSTTNVETLDLPNHSWNAVKLKNKWYLCDPTWASGIPNPTTNRFRFQYNDGFFLANPKLFAVNHFPIDRRWWLLDDEDIPSFETFLKSPVLYGNAYKNLENHYEPQQMHHTIKPYKTLAFNYLLKKTIQPEQVKLGFDNGFSEWKEQPTSISIKDKSLEFEHQFNQTGFYDVHLYIDNDLISTYTVEVKK
ncbi:MAG: transglutaminase domain-containing protein [Winogradskyella sp.]